MRTVIDHHVYDTATAQLVHTAETPAGCETLYRKRTGEYFLLDADYCIEVGDYDDAREWAAEHMPADDFDREFSGTPTTSTPVRVNVMLRADLYDRLVNESRRTGRSKTAIITDALDAALS